MKVVVFSGPGCSGCEALKTSLEAARIPFEEVNVDTQEGAKSAIKHGVRTLPTTLLMDHDAVVQKFIGFNFLHIKEITRGLR